MIDKRNNTGGNPSRWDGGSGGNPSRWDGGSGGNPSQWDGGSGEGIDSTLRDLTSLPSPSPSLGDGPTEKVDDGLLVCGECHSRLVYPADCEGRGRDHWSIELKCPDCGHHVWARFDVEMLDALDRELDRAEAEIEADLAYLTRANMNEYVTRFVAALDAGAIEPEDFAA